jgi:hypothetical protein
MFTIVTSIKPGNRPLNFFKSQGKTTHRRHVNHSLHILSDV